MRKPPKKPMAPIILRLRRLIDAFARSNDERDFYLDNIEGSIVFVDLDKDSRYLKNWEKELGANSSRYFPFPKLTSYEVKKIMEGFVQEKIYDIDTKERLLDIIQSKGARGNFLEFIYERHIELDKWLQYYQEKMRIYLIEWLRHNDFRFVFEEDLDLSKDVIEQFKKTFFQKRVSKNLMSVRKMVEKKASAYYSNEALNPKPKRGRPPKQIIKVEVKQELSGDFYTEVPNAVQEFLFAPDSDALLGLTFADQGDGSLEKFAEVKVMPKFGGDYRLGNFTDRLTMLETARELSKQQMMDSKIADLESKKERSKIDKQALKEPDLKKSKLKKIIPEKKKATKKAQKPSKTHVRKIVSAKPAKGKKVKFKKLVKKAPAPKKTAQRKSASVVKSRNGKIRLKRVVTKKTKK